MQDAATTVTDLGIEVWLLRLGHMHSSVSTLHYTLMADSEVAADSEHERCLQID